MGAPHLSEKPWGRLRSSRTEAQTWGRSSYEDPETHFLYKEGSEAGLGDSCFLPSLYHPSDHS